jgi:hypothetical protein
VVENREAFVVWGIVTMLLGGLPGAILLLYGAWISDRDRLAAERARHLASHPWSQDQPAAADYYWYWKEGQTGPILDYVSNRHGPWQFGNYGFCSELGGWWLRATLPPTPATAPQDGGTKDA